MSTHSLGFLDEQSNIDSDSQTAPSVWATRKKRTKKRHKQRFHVVMRFLAGQSVTEIARREHISRWTVRRILNKRRAAVASICEQMMWQAAREAKWHEARFWQACIERLDAKAPWGKATRNEVREWRKRLAMLWHNIMSQSADIMALAARDWIKRAGYRADDTREMKRCLGIEYPVCVIQILRQLMWRATAELNVLIERFKEAPAEAGRDAISKMAAERGFWAAIYSPIQLRLVRRALEDHLRSQAA